MKAGIYLGKESVEIRDIPMPDCGDNDVLIENIYSSISETDAAVYKNGPGSRHAVMAGHEFGHETISRVVDFGMNVFDFNLGERVYPYARGIKRQPGHSDTIGGFSEFILAEDARINESLYPIPDSVSDRAACLIEPFTIGCRAARSGMRLRRAEEVFFIATDNQPYEGDIRYQDGENAIVFGAGITGIATALCLRWFGMEKVMVCDRSDLRLQLAANFGLATCNIEKEDFASKTFACFGTARSLKGQTADIDCWIDTTDAPSVLEDFLSTGKIGSRLVSMTATDLCCPIDLGELTASRKSIIGAGDSLPEDVQDVVSLMASGVWDIESLITHEFPIDQLEEALRTAGDREHAGTVVIKF